MVRSNLNVSYSDFFADHKYINVAKAGSRILGNNSASDPVWYDDTKLNADHYPIEATNGISFQTYMLAGTYVARWQGSGSVTSVSISGKTNASSGIYTGGGADGSIVTNGRFTFTANSIGYISFSVKGTSISNLVLCLATEEAALDGGQMFRTAYQNQIKAYNGVLRFSVGPQYIPTNQLCNWADRAQTSLITYNGGRYYVGRKLGTTSGTNTYTVGSYTGMPVSNTHGELVQFAIGTSNDNATCTLAVGGRTAAPLVFTNNTTPATTGSNATTRFVANSTYTAMYDSTLAKWVAGFKAYAETGHPLEAMIQECNETSCPGWFSVPFWASDDYVTQFATLLCNTYQPATVYIEYVNEVWNFGAGFPFTSLAAAYGVSVLGLSATNNAHLSGWYGLRFRQIATIMRGVFASAGQSAKLKMVLASQGAAGDTSATLTAQVENVRFQNSGNAQLTGANAPILFADVIAYALYFGGNSVAGDSGTTAIDTAYARVVQNAAALKGWVDQYLAGTTTAAFQSLRDDLIANESKASGPFLTRLTNWNTLAASYGKEVRLYESNWQLCAPTANWCKSGSVILFSSAGNKSLSSNAISKMVTSLGLLNTSGTGPGGDTINSTGLNALARLNKAGNAISGSTALSGSAGSDSVVTDFAASDTLVVSGTTITFVASGASGNQINITDTIGALLTKIDGITATSVASNVQAPVFDTSYGDQTGKIQQFLFAFMASAQAEQVWRRYLKDFFSLSKSAGWALLGIPGAIPWSVFAQVAQSGATGDMTLASFGNWNGVSDDNNGKRAMIW